MRILVLLTGMSAVAIAGAIAMADGPPPPAAVRHEIGVDLVVNGTLEKKHRGRPGPLGFEEPDGLTSFWETHPKHGHVIRLDTDVLQSEHDKRLEEMRIPHDRRSPPKRKGPTTPPKYDTVGGNKGATLRTDPIPVEPGARYKVTVDVWTKGPEVFIWVKGYGVIPKRGAIPMRRRKLTDKHFIIAPDRTPDGWETFTFECRPTYRPKQLRGSIPVRDIQIQLYAYWPPGEALFDNLKFEKVGMEKESGD